MGKYEEYTYSGVKWRVLVVNSLEEGFAAIQRGEEAIKFYFVANIGLDGEKEVAAELKNNRTLKLLNLWSNKIGPEGAGSLAAALKVNSSLTFLNLYGNNIGPEGAGSLAEALKVNSTLTTLDLRFNKIGSEGAGLLAEALKVNSSLTDLNFQDNKIGPEGAGSLAEALKVNSTLTFLNLYGNEIGSEGAGSLAEALKVNSTLTALNLYENGIGSEGAGSLAEALKVNSSLTDLNLWDNNIGPEEAGSLAEALKVNSSLADLNLEGNEIRDQRVGSLAEALKVNSTLTAVNLRSNSIGDEGAGSLGESLKVNSTLTALDLGWNLIGPEGAGSLAEALKVNNTLTTLDLGRNEIDPEGAGSLAEALKVNRKLTELDLWDNNIGPEGACSLAEALKVNCTLTTLYLHSNKIGPEGAGSLAEALKLNRTLTTLNLEDNQIGTPMGLYCRLISPAIEIDRDPRVDTVLLFQCAFLDLGIEPHKAVPEEVFEHDSDEDAIHTKLYCEELIFGHGQGGLRRAKILLVGDAAAGKTSLCNALLTKGMSSRLTGVDDDRATPGVVVHSLDVEHEGESGKVSIWDFGGQPEYYATHSFFLTKRSVVMLVVDLFAYDMTQTSFDRLAGCWLRILQGQLEAPKVILVGTKADKCGKSVQKKMDNLQANLEDFLRRTHEQVAAVRDRMRKKGSRKTEEEQRANRLAKLEILCEPYVVSSNQDLSGVEDLFNYLASLATNFERGVALAVPKRFEALHAVIEERAKTQPVVSLEDLLQDTEMDRETCQVALWLMQDLGLVVWLHRVDQLAKDVFIRPQWIVNVLRAIVRHDMFVTENGNPGRVYQLDFPKKDQVEKFAKDAILHEELLRALWGREDDICLNEKEIRLCLELLLTLDMVYQSDLNGSWYHVPFYLTERRNRQSLGKRLSNRLSIGLSRLATPTRRRNVFRIEWSFRFFVILPFGLFPRLVSSLHPVCHIEKDKTTSTVLEGKLDELLRDAVAAQDKKKISVGLSVAEHRALDGSGWVHVACTAECTRRNLLADIRCAVMSAFSRVIQRVNSMLEQYPSVPYECIVRSKTANGIALGLPRYELEKAREKPIVKERDGVITDHVAMYQVNPSYEILEGEVELVQLADLSPEPFLVEVSGDGKGLYGFKIQLEGLLADAETRLNEPKVTRFVRGLLSAAILKLPHGRLHEEDAALAQQIVRATRRLNQWTRNGDEREANRIEGTRVLIQCARRVLARILLDKDVFLSHNWGEDVEGRDNHKRVVQLAQALEQHHGLTVWTDYGEVKYVEADLMEKIFTGIEGSSVFAVCLTEKYIAKAKDANKSDYCEKEFRHGVNQRPKIHRIPIVMEEDLEDESRWMGKIGGELSGGMRCKYLDDEDEDEESWQNSVNYIAESLFEVLFPIEEDRAMREQIWKWYKV